MLPDCSEEQQSDLRDQQFDGRENKPVLANCPFQDHRKKFRKASDYEAFWYIGMYNLDKKIIIQFKFVTLKACFKCEGKNTPSQFTASLAFWTVPRTISALRLSANLSMKWLSTGN